MKEDMQMQANMLKVLKPMLKTSQRKLIDVAVALAESGDSWVQDEQDADELLEEIKNILKED